MSYREYAIVENPNSVPEHYALKQNWGISEIGKIILINDQGKASPLFLTVDFITMVDKVNNCRYFLQMENSKLVSFCYCSKIEVTKLPDKMDYLEGQAFDPTGIKVIAICEDGSRREITNEINIADNVFIFSNEDEVVISYTELGIEFTTIISGGFNVTKFDPTVHLIDFTYNTNEDGTYTLTEWKQTLNGEASTEMIIPDNNLIRI